MLMADLITPDWTVPENVACVSTTRCGGFSQGRFSGLNLAASVGDRMQDVVRNREILCRLLNLPNEPCWLEQQHSAQVIKLPRDDDCCLQADAVYTTTPGIVCGVLTADCLPVLFSDSDGSCIAVAHAGWRGLLGGVLENTLDALPVPASKLFCWLGPAIGPEKFEVREDLRDRFVIKSREHAVAFHMILPGQFLVDIYQIAKNILTSKGVRFISGGGFCTYTQRQKFFSYRRDGITGRMATLIWMRAS